MTTQGESLKLRAARAAAAAARLYLRHFPLAAGKETVFRRVVQPHIAWRDFPLEIRTPFGATFEGRLRDLIPRFLYFFGEFEPGVSRQYREHLRPGDVVVDVGANIGAHALLAAHLVGPQGRVHAVEASPSIFRRLAANIAASGAQDRVVAHNLAATATPCTVPIFLGDGSNEGSTTLLPDVMKDARASLEAEIEGRPLPAIVPEADLLRARLLKIDVEGAEWMVLQGLRPLLPRLAPDVRVLLEVAPAALEETGGSLDALLALFAEAGFAPPLEIPNRYDAGFYINPGDLAPRPFRPDGTRMADLLFARPASAAPTAAR
jgi:FkbM family methyltransferase